MSKHLVNRVFSIEQKDRHRGANQNMLSNFTEWRNKRESNHQKQNDEKVGEDTCKMSSGGKVTK